MEIYKSIVVCRKLPLTIECTFAYDDYILVGTKEGHLLMYKLDIKARTPSEYEIKTHLLRSARQFSRKPILQIEAIPEHRILLSLSDGIISIHNLDKISFPHLSTLTKTKGATHFALDVSRIKTLTGEIQTTVRLVVVVRYHLQFYYWKNNEFHELRPSIKLTDTPRSVIWLGRFLYVALRNQYMQVAIESGSTKELFSYREIAGSTAGIEPLMLPLTSSGGSIGILGSGTGSGSTSTGLALCRDKQTFILDSEAKPLLDFPFTWSDAPLSIADDSLFLIAIVGGSGNGSTECTLEVLTNSASKILPVQRIRYEAPGTVNRPVKSIGKWRGRSGQLVLHSENDVVLVKAVAREQQIKVLQSEKYFELALKIVELYSNDPDEAGGPLQLDTDTVSLASVSNITAADTLSISPPTSDPSETEKLKLRIRNLQALDKFCRGDFKEAVSIFASLKTDPSYVIGLYPDLLPEDFRSKLNYPQALPHFEGAILEQGLLVLIDYLLEIRRKIKDDIKQLEMAAGKSGKPGADDQSRHIPMLRYPDLVKLQSIIDTSLLKCYLHTNDALVAPLLRIPDNHCHLEETEKALKRRAKYNELVILYRTKGLHRNALDLLQRQARFNSEKDAAVNRRKLIMYLQELGAEHIDLIFEYSEWILREHAEEGLEIFIDDSVHELDESMALPRELVLEFLERRIAEPALVMAYLEHCIFSWNETRARFHDALISKYREKIRSLLADGSGSYLSVQVEDSMEILDEEEDVSPDQHRRSSLASSNHHRQYHPLRPEPAGQEPGDLGPYRRKLMRLLEESDHYSTETLPTYLLHDGLFEERAIVMGKIGNHQEALSIYVHILQDLQRAEEYCTRVYERADKSPTSTPTKAPPAAAAPSTPSTTIFSGKDVFLLLFQQCLSTPNPAELRLGFRGLDSTRHPLSPYSDMSTSVSSTSTTQLDANVRIAINILGRHATRINLLRAVEMLPPELPLDALTTILTTSMEYMTSRKNYVQILRQLLHTQRLRAHEARIRMEQTTRLVVTTMDICQVCAKKIGKSVFVRYLNKDLVHFGCREVYEQKYL